jgi:hypothetical protein
LSSHLRTNVHLKKIEETFYSKEKTMEYEIFITYDLHDVDPSIYNALKPALILDKWAPLGPSTSWRKFFKSTDSHEDVIETAMNDFRQIISDLGIETFDACIINVTGNPIMLFNETEI